MIIMHLLLYVNKLARCFSIIPAICIVIFLNLFTISAMVYNSDKSIQNANIISLLVYLHLHIALNNAMISIKSQVYFMSMMMT